MSEYDIDSSTVKAGLSNKALEIAIYLLPGGKLNGNTWQVGSVGGEEGKSLHISISGAGAGLWHDFATGEGGDLISLWMQIYGLSFRDALYEAAQYLGIEPNAYDRPLSKEAVELLKQSLDLGLNVDDRERLRALTKGFKKIKG